jgi:hypothetical protein
MCVAGADRRGGVVGILSGAPTREAEDVMIPKMKAKALVRLQQEREAQAKTAAARVVAYTKKVEALAYYKSVCVGCGNRNPSQVFLALPEDLDDPTVSRLSRGQEYVLASWPHVALYERVKASGGTLEYAVFCWDCFKAMGRARRAAQGIRHPSDPQMRALQRLEEERLARSLKKQLNLDDNLDAQ